MTDEQVPKILKGGEFLIKESDPQSIFIPEDFNEEQLLIRSTVRSFVENEIWKKGSKLENQVNLLREAASLGLLGAHVSEEYGGMPMDTHSNTIISEELGRGDASFNTSIAAHTGIGMLPIYYFGSEHLKKKYLALLCSGEIKASYCLTEPESGSDALNAKTTAVFDKERNEFILTGQKMWISNAGFADIFIVFAQVDGDRFTCFVVDRNTDGLTLGEEENKLGIKGSSTRQVFLDNVKIPASQLLGEIGKGHLIAFNVLNIGRFKLGSMAMGGCKHCIDIGLKYANQRVQFGQKISSYGAIQYKIAESIIKTFAIESTVYRVSDLIEDKIQEELKKGASKSDAMLKASEEYAIECAIIKVYGSDVLDYVVDELLQIHGGYGYSEEYAPAKLYRDARINRIYEGTNEINRMLIVNMLLRRTMKGSLDLVGPAWEVQKELSSIPVFEMPQGTFGSALMTIKDFKKICLMVAGAAVKYQMDGKHDLKKEQEILMNIADIIIDLYTCESVYLRIVKLAQSRNINELESLYSILKIMLNDAQSRISKSATDALASFATGDELKIMLLGIKRFTKFEAQNVKHLRQSIVKPAIQAEVYPF